MVTINNLVFKYAYCFILLVYPASELGAQDAKVWLKQMSEAMRSQNYTGTFVYINNDKVEAMQIEHRNSSEGISERLYSLNGAAREIVRHNSIVTCIWPDTRSVMVDKVGQKNHFPIKLPENPAELEKHYIISLKDEDRIADHRCKIIDITPRDEYRYGYRMCVDIDSHLMVKSTVLDERGKPIEHVMFTDLKVSQNDANEALKPLFLGEDFKYSTQEEVEAPEGISGGSPMRSGKFPAGFMMIKMHRKRVEGENKVVDHMIYSDGMATVSVFIEKHDGDRKMLKGNSRMGAVHAFGRHLEDYHVTVVGEVPAKTVDMIGSSIELVTE